VFNGKVALQAGGATLDAGSYSRPVTTDWDEDGVTDLLVGDNAGFVGYYQAKGILSLSDNKISAAAGGTIDMELNAGVANGNRSYLMLGSITGTSPGTPLPGGLVTLPINWDIFTNIVLSLLNAPTFQNFLGGLSPTGGASAQLFIPGPQTGATGLNMSFAFALSGPWDFVSNGARVEIIP
jgi:hypothetical protein